MGAIAAIGAVVGSVLGSVGIAVTATALTVGFETIAAVGAVVGAVGAVTKNKALSFAGLAIGAVGGIGALASSAGLLGSGAGLLGEAPTTAAAADAASAGTIDSVVGSAATGTTGTAIGSEAGAAEEALGLPAGAGSQAAAGGVGLGDVTNAAGVAKGGLSLFATEGQPVPSAGTTPTTTESLNAAELARVTTPTAPTAIQTSAVPPPADLTPGGASNVGGPSAKGFLSQAFGSSAVPGGDLSISGDSKGAFSGLLEFANKNPAIAFGALQAGGSLLSGATNQLTPAQVNQLNSQAAANDAATALVKQQTANLAAPKAVASSAPVTGQAQLVPTPLRPPTPVIQPSGPAGFINQNPVPSQPITGTAA